MVHKILAGRPALLVLLLSVMIPAAGCVGEGDVKNLDGSIEETETGQELALINGTVTRARPEIGLLFMNGSMCTATLISPRAAITARHCVAYTTCLTEACASGYGGQLFFQRASGGYASYDVVAFESYWRNGAVAQGGTVEEIDYLDSQRSDFWLSDDVALVLLEESVPTSVAQPVGLSDSAAGAGTDLTVWGFGCTVRGGTSDYQKRFRDFAVGTRSDNLCPGDSGGPVTVGRDGQVRYVNSAYTISRDSRDIFGDVDYFRDEIDGRLRSWGQLATPTPPTPAPTPEPPVTTTPQPIRVTSSAAIPIADRSSTTRSVTFEQSATVGRVEITLNINHTSPLDLAFVLRAPDGRSVVLQQPNQDNSTSRAYAVDAFAGADLKGVWRVDFYDVYRYDVGQVEDFAMTFNFQ